MEEKTKSLYHHLDFLSDSIGKDDVGVWHIGKTGKDGIIQIPWCEKSKKLMIFLEDFYKSKMLKTDYIECMEKLELKSFEDISGFIEVALLEDLKTMLTFVIRRDRVTEGLLVAEVKSGLVYKIINKIYELDMKGE